MASKEYEHNEDSNDLGITPEVFELIYRAIHYREYHDIEWYTPAQRKAFADRAASMIAMLKELRKEP